MGNLGAHQVVELPRLEHMLNRVSHFYVLRVLVLHSNLVQHVVENVSNHLDLHPLLQIEVLLAKSLICGHILARLILLLLEELCQLSDLHVHILLIGRNFRVLVANVFVDTFDLLLELRVVFNLLRS